jgi:hypothetical protein
MIRNRFVLLLDLFLIILSVLGWRTVTNGCEADKRITRALHPFIRFAKQSAGHFHPILKQLVKVTGTNPQKFEHAKRTIHNSSFMKLRNRFVLLFNLLLIILSVLGLRTMTSGC